jgi:hypothetical protein
MSGAGDPFHSQIMTLFRRRFRFVRRHVFRPRQTAAAANRRRIANFPCKPPGDFAYTHHFAKA